MAGRRRKRRDESDPAGGPLRGQRLVQPLLKALKRLHHRGAERDAAGNRRLFYDQYVALLLMYFFNPALDSLRALQQATGWEKTRQALGIERSSLGSLSEAARVFDAEPLRAILQELAVQADAAVRVAAGSEPAALAAALQSGRLYVVDRGYADYELFAQIVAAGSSLIARVKDNIAYVVQEERPVGAAAKA